MCVSMFFFLVRATVLERERERETWRNQTCEGERVCVCVSDCASVCEERRLGSQWEWEWK